MLNINIGLYFFNTWTSEHSTGLSIVSLSYFNQVCSYKNRLAFVCYWSHIVNNFTIPIWKEFLLTKKDSNTTCCSKVSPCDYSSSASGVESFPPGESKNRSEIDAALSETNELFDRAKRERWRRLMSLSVDAIRQPVTTLLFLVHLAAVSHVHGVLFVQFASQSMLQPLNCASNKLKRTLSELLQSGDRWSKVDSCLTSCQLLIAHYNLLPNYVKIMQSDEMICFSWLLFVQYGSSVIGCNDHGSCDARTSKRTSRRTTPAVDATLIFATKTATGKHSILSLEMSSQFHIDCCVNFNWSIILWHSFTMKMSFFELFL